MKYEHWRIWQDGMSVAEVYAPAGRAFKEITHYAIACFDDGPLEIQKRVRGKWQHCDEENAK